MPDDHILSVPNAQRLVGIADELEAMIDIMRVHTSASGRRRSISRSA